jgi:hypothetical protein
MIHELMLLGIATPPNDPTIDGSTTINDTMIIGSLPEHDCIMTLAIADVIDLPRTGMFSATLPTKDPLPEPTLVVLMMLLLQTTSQTILARLDTMDHKINDHKSQQNTKQTLQRSCA